MASTGALEGVVIAIVMVSALTFVVTYEQPASSIEGLDRLMDIRAQDFLRIANDFPLEPSPCGGLTVADQMIVEAFGQEGSTWKTRRDRYFGNGIDTNLYVLNGRAAMPIYENYDFKGVAVTAPWTPQFNWVKPVASTGWTGTEDVQIQAAPINFGEIVRMRGDAIRMTATSTNGVSEQKSLTWAPIAMRSGAQAPSTFGWSESDAIDTTREFRVDELTLVADGSDLRQLIRIGSLASAPLPSGTTLRIVAPTGWTMNITGTGAENPAWEVDGQSRGSVLLATSTVELGPQHDFELLFRPPLDSTKPYDVFHAILGGGSFARSSLVVTFPHAADAEVPRELFPTVPYPVPAGSTALIGAAFANGPEAVTITQFDIEIPGGYDLQRHDGGGAELFMQAIEPVFPADSDVSDDRGWKWLDPKHIRWTGKVNVGAREAAQFLIRVPITDDASQETSLESLVLEPTRTTLTFANGFADTSWEWSQSPGLIRHRISPDSESEDGYPFLATDETSFVAQVERPGVNVSQPWTYSVAPDASLLKLQNGVTNSSFQVLDRSVPLGTVVQAEADLQSIFTALAGQGVNDATVNVSLYTPASMGCVPTRSWVTTAGSLASAKTNGLELWAPDGALGSLFLSAGDRSVYRIEAGGAPRWATEQGSEPGRFVPVSNGVARGLIGTNSNGTLFRMDAATGAVLATSPPFGSTAARALAAHPSQPTVLVTSSGGSVHLLGWDLQPIASYEAVTFENAVFGPDGSIFAVNGSSNVERFPATLEGPPRSATLAGFEIRALAPNSQRVLFSHLLGWGVFDPDTLKVTAQGDLSHPVTHDATGDANGDGVLDLAFVAGETLYLVDGATLAVAKHVPNFATEGAKWEKSVWGLTASSCQLDPDPDDTEVSTVQAAYGGSPLCNRHERSGPLVLRIQDERVMYAFAQAEKAHVCVFGSGLEKLWCRGPLPNLVPSGFARGPYGALADATAVSYEDGTIEIRADGTGDIIDTLHPTQTTGRFTIRFPIPLAGFFGAHVLVAAVEWQEGGQDRSVSLADWFQVVDIDGRPISRPMYTLVLSARDLAQPSRDP